MSDDFKNDHRIETYKSMITISIEVFRFLVLLNGAAAAGIVAAIDKLQHMMWAYAIRDALTCFVAGLAFAGGAMAFSYFTQLRLYNETMDRAKKGGHQWFIRGSVACTMLSLAAFVFGAVRAVGGLAI